jgi:hypothetical protein
VEAGIMGVPASKITRKIELHPSHVFPDSFIWFLIAVVSSIDIF